MKTGIEIFGEKKKEKKKRLEPRVKWRLTDKFLVKNIEYHHVCLFVCHIFPSFLHSLLVMLSWNFVWFCFVCSVGVGGWGSWRAQRKGLIRPNKCWNTSSVRPKLGKIFYHGGVGTERKREWRNVRVVGNNHREDRMRPILTPCAFFALKFWYLWCVLEHGFAKIIILQNISPKLIMKELNFFSLSLGVARPFLLTFWA